VPAPVLKGARSSAPLCAQHAPLHQRLRLGDQKQRLAIGALMQPQIQEYTHVMTTFLRQFYGSFTRLL
jgi:hypothetical protein